MEINDNVQQSKPTPSHSRLGIAAFITGLLTLCILASYWGVLIAGIASLDSDPTLYEKTPRILFYVLCSTSLLSLITLVLSVIPLFQKERNKLFAILALVAWIVSVILIIISFFTYFIFTS